MITRRNLLLAAASPFARERKNVVVFQHPGRYGGWPANHGLWSWGSEAVVGFTAAWYKPNTAGHAVDREKRFEDWQSRTLDSGETWSIEKPPLTTNADNHVPHLTQLGEPLDFTSPGFAMMFGMTGIHGGPAWLYASADRCRTWSKPFAFAVDGIGGLAPRTNYLVYGKRECIMFGSASKADKREGRVFCARTTDGGINWTLLSLIGPEPAGYMIMPSVVRLTDSRLLVAIRHKDPDKQGSIDFYLSEERGVSWKPFGIIDNLGGGNPPALVKLADGRLAITYGYRAKPWGVRARISMDQGRTWGEEMVLRDDALTGDLGYPVAYQRPDSRVVSIYYFNGPRDEDRTIQATIWQP